MFVKRINISLFIIYIIVANTSLLDNVKIEFALMLLWSAFALIWKKHIRIDWKVIPVLWILYEIFLRIINFSTAAWGNYIIRILFFFPLFVFDFYNVFLEAEEKKKILKYYIMVVLLNVIENVVVLLKYPKYNLELNYGTTYNGMVLRYLNLGNSMFSFLVMLFTIVMFYYAIIGKRKYWFLFFVSFGYMILSSKTTALLMMLVGLLMVILNRISEIVKKSQRIMLSILVVLGFLLLYFGGIPFLAAHITNENIRERLYAIINNDFDSVYFERINLAKMSFTSFLKHPLFGIGYEFFDAQTVDTYSTGIGHHSAVIDLMGRYGFVGIFIWIFMAVRFIKWLNELNGSFLEKSIGKILLIVIFLYSFLNNIVDVSIGLFMFYLIPCIYSRFFEPQEDSDIIFDVLESKGYE